MTKRPYADATNKLSSAWRHLSRRRTRGDNEARVVLRGLRATLTLAVFNEALLNIYTPAIKKQLSKSTIWTRWVRTKP